MQGLRLAEQALKSLVHRPAWFTHGIAESSGHVWLLRFVLFQSLSFGLSRLRHFIWQIRCAISVQCSALGFGLHCGRAGHVSLGCVGVVYRLFCFGVQFLIWTGLVGLLCFLLLGYSPIRFRGSHRSSCSVCRVFCRHVQRALRWWHIPSPGIVSGWARQLVRSFSSLFSGHYAVVRLPDQ